MNVDVLNSAVSHFLTKYPGGFDDPEMLVHAKKHKMEQMASMVQEVFAKDQFSDPDRMIESMVNIMNRSSLISMFEKPRFREAAALLTPQQRDDLVMGLFEILHGKEKQGFEQYVEVLSQMKLAKWTFATVIQAYYRPQQEVLVKPTTTKLIIDKLELDLTYKPKPTWDFYQAYRKIINELKSDVDDSLSPSNPAFCGFLMMSL